MNDSYLILAYVISIALLWGYAIVLWMTARALLRRERNSSSPNRPQGASPS